MRGFKCGEVITWSFRNLLRFAQLAHFNFNFVQAPVAILQQLHHFLNKPNVV